MDNSNTSVPSGQVKPALNSETETPQPQTYEEWCKQRGYIHPDDIEIRLEVNQRVKAACYLAEDDWYSGEWDGDKPPETVDRGTLGTITSLSEKDTYLYEVQFDNGVKWWCCWDKELDADEMSEITPVGKSPSELAHEQVERERLAAFKQLSLFEEMS